MIATLDETAGGKLRAAGEFARAYVETALWSSTEFPFGECPCCGRVALLCKLPELEFEQELLCDGPECGVLEGQPEPMDRNYSPEDLAPKTLQRMLADCARFEAEHGEVIQAAIDTGEVVSGPDFGPWGRAGHDFWLTRNGHGAGFWDGDWPEPFAEKLTAAAKAAGMCNLYAGDDGRIYLA